MSDHEVLPLETTKILQTTTTQFLRRHITCVEDLWRRIASFGTLCTWAEIIDDEHAKKLLAMNIAEEFANHQKLRRLSVSTNSAATHHAAM